MRGYLHNDSLVIGLKQCIMFRDPATHKRVHTINYDTLVCVHELFLCVQDPPLLELFYCALNGLSRTRRQRLNHRNEMTHCLISLNIISAWFSKRSVLCSFSQVSVVNACFRFSLIDSCILRLCGSAYCDCFFQVLHHPMSVRRCSCIITFL